MSLFVKLVKSVISCLIRIGISFIEFLNLADKYTFAYNVSILSAILICPINGYLLGFKADKSKFIII